MVAMFRPHGRTGDDGEALVRPLRAAVRAGPRRSAIGCCTSNTYTQAGPEFYGRFGRRARSIEEYEGEQVVVMKKALTRVSAQDRM
jgi:hypothetical protein